MTSAFPLLRNTVGRNLPTPRDATLRDFSGGLRVTENEIALNSKYATKLVNVFVEKDNSQVLRFGTKEFSVCTDRILNMVYFRDFIIAAFENGEVQKVDANGIATTIWNTAIANALPGSPDGWSTNLDLVDFTDFRGELILTNGIDKPIIVESDLTVKYLQDPSSGTNIHTPVTKYCTTVSNYTVMAGDPNNPSVVYVSSTGTSGVWPGDADPNDSISFDVGAYTGEQSTDILAVASFKNYLVVYFAEFSAIFQLGVFDATNAHVPQIVDTYDKLGTVNHKTMITTKSDLIFPANEGVISAAKNIFGGTLDTNGRSENLGDLYLRAIGNVKVNEQNCFAVNDTLSSTMFFSFKKEDNTYAIFGMRYTKDIKRVAWTELAGWSFTSACTSEKGRVFFSQGNMIYQYGNSIYDDEDYHADLISASNPDGDEIAFEWELPWLDTNKRARTKKLTYISFDTTGTSDFLVQCFVNNYYKDIDGNLDPATEMLFRAGNSSGYGAAGFGTEGYGGGRRANDERFFGMPLKFKIMKMRISGTTRRPLRIASISMLFITGNFRP